MAFLRFAPTASRVRRNALMVALLAGSLSVWLAVGGIGAAPARSLGSVKADIEAGNENCGDTTGADVIGTATFTRKTKAPDTLKGVYKLTNGTPGTKYVVQLWEYFGPGDCALLRQYGVIRTDTKGKASKKFEFKPSGGMTEVFASGYDANAGQYNDSLHVTI